MKPFHYHSDSLNYDVVFRCPHCGCRSCLPADHFLEGFHFCAGCGMSRYRGREFNYYNDSCFHIVPCVVQLTFDF